AAMLMTKVLFRLPLDLAEVELPDYSMAAASALLVLGLLGSDTRGVVLAVAGGVLAGLSVLVEVAQLTNHWDALASGLPLAVGGAAGLALFSHGLLHPSPALAQRGIDLARPSALVS